MDHKLLTCEAALFGSELLSKAEAIQQQKPSATTWANAMSNPYQSPTSQDPPLQPSATNQPDATGGVIPYKNPHALFAYYGSIATLLCCISPLPLGLVPVWLGIVGLRNRAKNPIIKGSIHAWIGIVLGGLSALGSCLMAIAFIAMLLSGEFK